MYHMYHMYQYQWNHYYNVPLIILVIILALWSITWKLYAVWTACKHNQKKWFIGLLILNTARILEIIYIFKFAGKSWVEVKGDFRRAWKSMK